MMGKLVALKLRTQYLEQPEGIDEARPRLGWIVQSARRGARQEAYQLLAASTPERLAADEGDLWDSGKVASPETQHIAYAGRPLASGQRVYWKVRAWDERGVAGDWSEPARWSMGLLRRDLWQGIWIGKKLKLRPTKEQPMPAVYLRREFQARGGIRRATAYATALGLYQLHINGQRIGDAAFPPEWTDYHVRTQYQAYDVTAQVREGGNVVAVVLGHGWYTGYIGMYGYQKYGMDPSFLLQLNLEFADGSQAHVATDQSWQLSLGPITGTDLQMGESYDARLEQDGWMEAGFDAAGWEPASRMYDYRGKLVAQLAPPIKAVQEIRPAEVRVTAEGHTLVDMGQATSGFLRVRLSGEAGTKYTLRYAEALDEQGKLYTANLRFARQTDSYICRGAGEPEVFQPAFTYHGYRYVEISGGGGPVAADDITGVVVYSSLPEAGQLETSEPLVNKLISNILWTQRANYMSVPTDCPQRDERHGWTGDAQIFAPTAAYNMDVAAFLGKWLIDLQDGQQPTGAYTDFAPFIFGPKTEFDNDFTYTHTGSAGWADAPPIIAWFLYEWYGDLQVLRRQYASLKRWMDYNEQLYPVGIRRDAPQYGDWLSLDERPFAETKAEFDWLVAGHSTTPYDVFATSYWVHGTALMAKISRALGEEADAQHYEALHESVRAAFVREFVDEQGVIRGDTQAVYAMALSWNLLPEHLREPALQRLVGKVESGGGQLATGFHGTKHLMEVLAASGHEELAFRLLLREQYPSWLYSVTQGATTIWERWDGWTEERGFQNPGMNSLCHYAFGSIGEWMYRHIGGIAPDTSEPGFAKAIIRPRPQGGIRSATCRFDSIRGRYRTAWRLDEGRFELELEVPANARATVYLPAAALEQVQEGGQPLAAAEGIVIRGHEGGCAVLEAGSGTYRFTSALI